MSGSAKPATFAQKLISILLHKIIYTQGLSTYKVSGQCEEVCFSGGHFAIPVKHECDNGAYGGHQLGGSDMELLSLLARCLLWPCGMV